MLSHNDKRLIKWCKDSDVYFNGDKGISIEVKSNGNGVDIVINDEDGFSDTKSLSIKPYELTIHSFLNKAIVFNGDEVIAVLTK